MDDQLSVEFSICYMGFVSKMNFVPKMFSVTLESTNPDYVCSFAWMQVDTLNRYSTNTRYFPYYLPNTNFLRLYYGFWMDSTMIVSKFNVENYFNAKIWLFCSSFTFAMTKISSALKGYFNLLTSMNIMWIHIFRSFDFKLSRVIHSRFDQKWSSVSRTDRNGILRQQ